jgi:hypothetical protein
MIKSPSWEGRKEGLYKKIQIGLALEGCISAGTKIKKVM